MVFLVGVAAALSLGFGYVLQQRVAATAPLSELLRVRLLLDLVRRPVWLLGIGAMIVGQLLSGLALQLGTVAVVEPLLSTNLLFALGFAALWSAHRLRWQELGGAALLSAALGVFIAVGDPHSSRTAAPRVAVVALAVGVVAAVVLTLVLVGRRRALVGESILLATGAGLLYGLQDASTRATLLVRDHHGVAAIFLNVWVYVVLATGVWGVLLSQSAFKAARLDCSLPPIAAAEPIAGIALGVSLLGDKVSLSAAGLALESVCLVAMIAAVVLIGRAPSLAAPTAAAVTPVREGPAGSP